MGKVIKLIFIVNCINYIDVWCIFDEICVGMKL